MFCYIEQIRKILFRFIVILCTRNKCKHEVSRATFACSTPCRLKEAWCLSIRSSENMICEFLEGLFNIEISPFLSCNSHMTQVCSKTVCRNTYHCVLMVISNMCVTELVYYSTWSVANTPHIPSDLCGSPTLEAKSTAINSCLYALPCATAPRCAHNETWLPQIKAKEIPYEILWKIPLKHILWIIKWSLKILT